MRRDNNLQNFAIKFHIKNDRTNKVISNSTEGSILARISSLLSVSFNIHEIRITLKGISEKQSLFIQQISAKRYRQ
jgi:hypothetical protein